MLASTRRLMALDSLVRLAYRATATTVQDVTSIPAREER